MDQQPSNNNGNSNGSDNPLLLALLSMLVGNGNAVNGPNGATELVGQSAALNSTPAAAGIDLRQLLSTAQRNAGNGNSNGNSNDSNTHNPNNNTNNYFQGNASQQWQSNPALQHPQQQQYQQQEQQQDSKQSPSHESELSIALANATCMLTAPGAILHTASASGTTAVNGLSNAHVAIKSTLGSNGTASSDVGTKSPILRAAPSNNTKREAGNRTHYMNHKVYTSSANSTRSNNSAHSTNSSSMSQGKSQTKSMVIPCHARGMTMHHNFRSAYFTVPENVEHGFDLVCSYADCQNRGVKFRWCSTCVAPVASRSFRQKHSHPAQQSSSSESDEAEASTGTQSDQAVACAAAGSASNGSRLSSSCDSSSTSGNSSQQSTSASPSPSASASASGSSDLCDNQKSPSSKDATVTMLKSAPSAKVDLDAGDHGQQNRSIVGDNDDGGSNPWDSSRARQNWMDLLHKRPLDSDPEAVSDWLGRVMATCTHQQMVSEESSEIPSDGANSHGSGDRSSGQNTTSTSSSSDDTAGSEDLNNSKESSWGGSESSSGAGGSDQADADEEGEEGEIVTTKRVTIDDPKSKRLDVGSADAKNNMGIKNQGGKRDLVGRYTQNAATAGTEAGRTTEPAAKRPRRN